MEDIINYGILAGLAFFAVLDIVAPARRTLPKVRFWRLKGVLSFALFMWLSAFAASLWDGWLAEYRLFDLTSLGFVGGTIVGILVLELVTYVWHRALHRVPFLWRWFHQWHHSAERVDIYGAYWFSPLDMIGWSFVYSFALVFLVGLTLEATLATIGIITVIAYVQHANIRTPHWLGYIINRPEGHMIHHERGVHAYNYADIALFDQIFGTWKNPKTWDEEAGFYDGASSRIPEMLIGRDVSEPPDSQEAHDLDVARSRTSHTGAAA
jgi:sterol desaturase/sphingolipid hydroxylase (fatty acid hydroxylase superfamily)